MRKQILTGALGLILAYACPASAAPRMAPDFCFNDQGNSAITNTSVRDGVWSDASVWSAGHVPNATDTVEIAEGTTVTVNVANAVADMVCVHGKLTFSPNVNTGLALATLNVEDEGTLEIGTTAVPIAAGVTAVVTFADTPLHITGDLHHPSDPEQYGNGLVAMGKVTIYGAPRDATFMRLAVEPKAGDMSLTLSQAVTGWQSGDTLIIPDTRHLLGSEKWGAYVPQWETVTVQSISGDGRSISLASSLRFGHDGARNADGALEFLPHVGNLTRNVVFRSANPNGTRGHVIFMHRADVDVRYAEFLDLGRTTKDPLDNTTFGADGTPTHIGTNQLARYPVHFHHLMGPTTTPANGYQFTLLGNSVFSSLQQTPYKWGIDVHDSHYGLVQDNVVFNWAGWGIGTEDGNESFNEFAHNFVVGIQGDANPRDNDGLYGAGFWFHGFNHRVHDNVAASCQTRLQGIVTGAGYDFTWHAASALDAAIPLFKGADVSVPGQYKMVDMQLVPIPQFERNEAYGAMATGLVIWNLGRNAPTGQTVIKDFRAWHFWEEGFFSYEIRNVLFDGYVVRGAARGLLSDMFANGWVTGDYFSDDITIRNADMQGLGAGIAGTTKTQGTFRIENSYFKNYNANIQIPSLAGPGSGNPQLPRHTQIVNCRFDAMASRPLKTIQMRWAAVGGDNFIVQDDVLVYNYQGVSGKNFQVFYPQQRPNALVPPTTTGGNGFGFWPADIGYPDGTSGHTNAEAIAAYPNGATVAGIFYPVPAVAGGISPCKDDACSNKLSSVPEIDGDVFPATLAPLVMLLAPEANGIISGTDVAATYRTFGNTPAGATVHLKLDAGTDIPVADLSGAYSYSQVSPGPHTLDAWLVDSSGAEISGTRTSVAFKTTLNKAPVITLVPGMTAQASHPTPIDASVADDGLPNGLVIFAWTKTSGAGDVTFTNPASAQTNVTFSAVGAYVLRLTANDGELTASKDITVTVVAGAPAGAPTRATRLFRPNHDEMAAECFSQAGYVDGAVYDRYGSKVRAINGDVASGGCLYWDGRDDSNSLMPSGAYFFRATQSGVHIKDIFVEVK